MFSMFIELKMLGTKSFSRSPFKSQHHHILQWKFGERGEKFSVQWSTLQWNFKLSSIVSVNFSLSRCKNRLKYTLSVCKHKFAEKVPSQSVVRSEKHLKSCPWKKVCERIQSIVTNDENMKKYLFQLRIKQKHLKSEEKLFNLQTWRLRMTRPFSAPVRFRKCCHNLDKLSKP